MNQSISSRTTRKYTQELYYWKLQEESKAFILNEIFNYIQCPFFYMNTS